MGLTPDHGLGDSCAALGCRDGEPAGITDLSVPDGTGGLRNLTGPVCRSHGPEACPLKVAI